VATRCKFRGRRGILCDVLKNDGGLARNIDFEVPNFTGDVFGRPPSANQQKQSLVFEQRVGKVFKMQGSNSST